MACLGVTFRSSQFGLGVSSRCARKRPQVVDTPGIYRKHILLPKLPVINRAMSSGESLANHKDMLPKLSVFPSHQSGLCHHVIRRKPRQSQRQPKHILLPEPSAKIVSWAPPPSTTAAVNFIPHRHFIPTRVEMWEPECFGGRGDGGPQKQYPIYSN